MSGRAATPSTTTVLHLATGSGWRVYDKICSAGPADRPFEEQHVRISVAAVLSGTFGYRSCMGRALMSPGCLLLGQRDAAFCCSHEHSHGDRCVSFHLEDSWIEDIAYEVPGVKSVQVVGHRIPPMETLAPLMAEIQAFADGSMPSAGEELAIRVTVAALDFPLGALAAKEVTRSDERKVSEVLRVIETRVTEQLSVGLLAELAGMSRYHFIRTFRRTTGEAPWRYILGRRLALAARNLMSSSQSVVDVALASGFGDLSEFSRRFHLRFGVPPAQYRNRVVCSRSVR